VFYRGTDICVFVYDVTNPASLENIHKWKQQYVEAQSSTMDGHTVFAVFGNKVRDLLLLVANHHRLMSAMNTTTAQAYTIVVVLRSG
jgi:GTPase SAR1 family protein